MRTRQTVHPPSLKIFFATEMWERYGFYVVQTLLVLYLSMHHGWDDSRIYPLIGAFTALTYLSPVIGGWIADHLLGQKRSILLGTVILFFSYIGLSESITETQLCLSLAAISIGTGLLKPNISSLLGNEYPIGSPNRERGFTIFYMGITSGIILGTTLPSFIQSRNGWADAFSSASSGMIIALVIFLFGIRQYRIADYSQYEHKHINIVYAFALLTALFYGAFYVLNESALANAVFTCIAVLSIIYLIATVTKETGKQAQQTVTIGLLCLISMMFWAFYFQMFSSFIIFLRRVTQPSIFGLPFPPPYYVAVQSIGMIVFGLFLGRNSKVKSLPEQTIRIGNKFVLAMIFMTAAYTLIAIVCHLEEGLSLISPVLIIPSFLMISAAELLLSPVGLSAITLLSSPKRVSTMMGIFFVSLGMGGYLSGRLASLTAIPQAELDLLSIIELKTRYAASFTQQLYILMGASVTSLLINFIIRKLAQRPEQQHSITTITE